ncbi:MAG: class I SAM-dependent methyltransferase [Rhodoferax sp.]|uniref:class I SAM-dependent methyltransferase n=1 Tax=Rhodoferax sp. TaxID=50421 RepID=UPI0008D3735B|nr:class I SAM-dependent methyltransferase [Rhodoferax sp.]MDP2677504.1 class I SAM-dependent methyltransferase [Rhodoferax sp.]OGB80907.1 MAG: methyltransferase type 11 [Burkholderiales bacterium RIFOXYD2_FULL_59_8]OGB81490.1 MAG: methyltransferase type 11 [Burkholderiales bacterium RIFOXYC12_FULL_60_6]
MSNPLVTDELDLLHRLVNLDQHRNIVELGCGAAALARKLLARFPGCEIAALEVDERQHAKNVLNPLQGLKFIQAGAQSMPLASEAFDLALMLKSLHHVPLPLLDQALSEVHRVLKPGGLLYVSEPVFAGALNEVMRLFHDEELVRAAALRGMQKAVSKGDWEQVNETLFDVPVQFHDFADFAARMIGVTFANHRLDTATLAQVRARFEQHMSADGAHFVRPMRVNLMRKR